LTEKPPVERFVDLGRLSDAGEEIDLVLKGRDLEAVAQWAEVRSVEAFRARIDIARKGGGYFHYEAEIEAELTQDCVVTLDPVPSHIDKKFSRELHLTRTPRRVVPEIEVLAPGAADDEAPEEITSPLYDIAGPVLEEFSLAIDPYPRSAGAAFESPADGEAGRENPFAVLKSLKTGL